MRRVYFDGTLESAGQLITACAMSDARVFVVTHRQLTLAEKRFLNGLCDCYGSIRVRQAHGSARRCARVVDDGTGAFFASWSDDDRVDFDRRVRLLEGLRTCDRASCGACDACVHVDRVAQEYGVYDILDTLEEMRASL